MDRGGTMSRSGARALLGLQKRRTPSTSPVVSSVGVSTHVSVHALGHDEDKALDPIELDTIREEPLPPTAATAQFNFNITSSVKNLFGSTKEKKVQPNVELKRLFEKMEETIQKEGKAEDYAANLVQAKQRYELEEGIQKEGLLSVSMMDSVISKDIAREREVQLNAESEENVIYESGDYKMEQKVKEEDALEDTHRRILKAKLSRNDSMGAKIVDNHKDADDPASKLQFVLNKASSFREKVILDSKMPHKSAELHPSVEAKLLAVATGVINDAWSRRKFELDRFENANTMKAYAILQNPLYKIFLKVVVFLHMLLAIFEPASTFKNPTCGKSYNINVTLAVEGFCLLVYLAHVFTMQVAYKEPFTCFRKGKSKQSKVYPLAITVISFILLFDWLLRVSVFYSTNSYAPIYAFSRGLRCVLLVLNTRPVRDMFMTITRVLPSVSILAAGCFLIILCFSVVGFHLFQGIYPNNSFPENFDSWTSSSILLFALFTTENYPEATSGAVEYSRWFIIYFLFVMLIGQGLLTVMLGLVYDSYKASVMKTALKNYRKEREALTAAFSLLSRCPSNKPCVKFPCKHGEGKMDQMTWTRLFSTFQFQARNSYVYKVFNRNAGGMANAQVSLIASELFKNATEKKMNKNVVGSEKALVKKEDAQSLSSNKLIFASAKTEDLNFETVNLDAEIQADLKGSSISSRKDSNESANKANASRKSIMFKNEYSKYSSESGSNLIQSLPGVKSKVDSLDIIGYFGLCDTIRSRMEVTVEKPVLKVKQSWLRVLQTLSVQQNLQVMESWQQKSTFIPQEVDSLKNSRIFEKENLTEFDIACETFKNQFNRLSGADKMTIRALMVENIDYLEKVFGDAVNTDPLVDLASASCLEMFISSPRWTNFVNLIILSHLILYILSGLDSSENSFAIQIGDSLSIVNLCFLGFYFLDFILRIYVTGRSFFKSTWNRFDMFVSMISLASSVSHFIPDAVDKIGLLALKTGASFIVLRFISVSVSMFESPANLRGRSRAYDRYIIFRNLVLNLFQIGVVMMWVLLVVYYLFAIIGMELFGCNGMQNMDLYNDPEDMINFDSIGSAFLSLFQITSTSNWMLIMYAAIRSSSVWATIYFVLFYFLVLSVILNLFTALVVEALVSLGGARNSDADRLLGKKNTFDLYTRFLD